jgi:hypothetical protein
MKVQWRAQFKKHRRAITLTCYGTIAFLILFTVVLRQHVNRDKGWISRAGETATWASLCESQGAAEVVICPPYSDPARCVQGRWPLNWFLTPMYATVNDNQYFVVMLSSRGRIVRNAIINPDEIHMIDDNSGTSEEQRKAKSPGIRRP